jgi:NADPH:quinone reductase-like Zn-dependent oxidoreductase
VRAVVIVKHGGIDVLQVQERPEPPLGPGRVRIDVRAAGVNFADTLARVGLYPDAPKPPCVVGYEVAGTIGASATASTRVASASGSWSRRRSAATPRRSWSPRPDVIVLPERLSFEEGAAVPVVYATGWASLYGFGSLRAGERVLVHAAAGGVGIAVLQLARRGGAEVHGTASPGKHARLRELGLDRAIDYPPRWLVARPARLRPRHRRHRRGVVQAPPTRCCAPAGGSSAWARPRSRRARRATCAERCLSPADDARLRPAQADGRLESRSSGST